MTGLSAITKFQLTRLVRGRKILLGVVAVVLMSGCVVAARYAGSGNPVDAVKRGVELAFFGLVVYLLPFLFLSGSIADEVESRTWTYLVTRPLSRTTIAFGKYLAGCGVAVPLVALGILVTYVAALAGTPAELGSAFPTALRHAGAASLLVATYGAISLMWGAVAVEAAGVVSLLYLAIVEFGLSLVPGPIRLASMNFHATQLAGYSINGPDWLREFTPTVTPLVASLVISGVGLAFLAIAALVVSNAEYRSGRA